jgi:2-polyprenyl-3-methyl-5-hydroxy-6-metoxy-1,4-benzoquinol methylase
MEHARLAVVRRRAAEVTEALTKLGARLRSVAETTRDDLSREAGRLEGAINELTNRLYPTPYTSDSTVIRAIDPHGRATIGYQGASVEPGGAYRAFEDVFRGPEDFIRDRQRSYADLLQAHAPVLDVGCGRGELLDVLAEAGIQAEGVDVDEGMIRRCREKGHRVVLADAIDYLSELDQGSLGSVSALHGVEHLEFGGLMRLLESASRAVRPGGLVVLETVNPHSLEAMKMFWIDPTHRVPIFPEVLTVLCGVAGFAASYVTSPNGTGDLENDRRTQGEYAVIAIA